MKLMLCGDCGDVVSPGLENLQVRWCACGRHAVWWMNATRGLLRVHDKHFPERNGGDGGRAWVIGLHNGLLTSDGLTHHGDRAYTDDKKELSVLKGNSATSKAGVERLLQETPATYLFKQAHSLAVRFTPGYTSDTKWSLLPQELLERGIDPSVSL